MLRLKEMQVGESKRVRMITVQGFYFVFEVIPQVAEPPTSVEALLGSQLIEGVFPCPGQQRAHLTYGH